MRRITIITRLFLFGTVLLPEASSFQQQHTNTARIPAVAARCCRPIQPKNNEPFQKKIESSSTLMFNPKKYEDDVPMMTAMMQKQHHHAMRTILATTIFGLYLVVSSGGTPPLANAATEGGADTSSSSSSTSIIIDGSTSIPTTTPTTTTTTSSNSGMSISNYFGAVFQSPPQSTTTTEPNQPIPLDPKSFTRDMRNAEYDAAFQRDARDRDVYYGKMAAAKRERAMEEVRQNRIALGLDGKGDVRTRVGDEREAGLASLRELLLEKNKDGDDVEKNNNDSSQQQQPLMMEENFEGK